MKTVQPIENERKRNQPMNDGPKKKKKTDGTLYLCKENGTMLDINVALLRLTHQIPIFLNKATILRQRILWLFAHPTTFGSIKDSKWREFIHLESNGSHLRANGMKLYLEFYNEKQQPLMPNFSRWLEWEFRLPSRQEQALQEYYTVVITSFFVPYEFEGAWSKVLQKFFVRLVRHFANPRNVGNESLLWTFRTATIAHMRSYSKGMEEDQVWLLNTFLALPDTQRLPPGAFEALECVPLEVIVPTFNEK
jgi:hypothetical protein